MTDPYFIAKARVALHQIAADNTKYEELAQWAEDHKGQEKDTNGVIVTRDGRIVAETFQVSDGVASPGGTYVKADSTDIVDAQNKEVSLAKGTIARAIGEPVCHIDIWSLTTGEAASSLRWVSKMDGRMTGDELRRARDIIGFSGDRLAAALDVRPDTLRKWETDRRPIPYGMARDLRAIAAAQIPVLQELVEELDDLAAKHDA